MRALLRGQEKNGVLILDEAGAVIGAAGASGDTSDNDEAALVAAIAEAG